jgi:hypothetical protein
VAKAWDAGRREGRWDHQHVSDEEAKRTQKAIADTMKSVVADQLAGRAYDPWRGSAGGPKAAPAGAVVATVPGEPEVQAQGEPWTPHGERVDWIRNGAGRSLESPLRREAGGVPLLPGLGEAKLEEEK